MKSPSDVARDYLAAWNEPDADKRRALIEQSWSPGATYRDPLMQAEGGQGISAMIGAAQAQFPGLAFRLASEPQAVHNCVRFSWHLAPATSPKAAPIAGGTDFCVLDSDGRLQSVSGFLDFAPGAQED